MTPDFDVFHVRRGRRSSTAVQVTVGTQALHLSAPAYDLLGRPARVKLFADIENEIYAIAAGVGSDPDTLAIVKMGRSEAGSVSSKAFVCWSGIRPSIIGQRFAAEMQDDKLVFGPGLDLPDLE
jgi:hypothetical protein